MLPDSASLGVELAVRLVRLGEPQIHQGRYCRISSFHTAKHETIHLLGYQMHNSFPLWVIGYADEPWWCVVRGQPRQEGLMVLLGAEEQLRQRTRAALTEFWAGLAQAGVVDTAVRE